MQVPSALRTAAQCESQRRCLSAPARCAFFRTFLTIYPEVPVDLHLIGAGFDEAARIAALLDPRQRSNNSVNLECRIG
jgi:hypothetical protein